MNGPLDLAGAVLSRKYALRRSIGAGGMGTVYEATNLEDSRPVAVKMLGVDYLDDADIKGRFLEEGRVCQRLIHPNIVRVFESSEAEDGTPYIVMELLEGIPLATYTRQGVRVPMAQAATIMQGVLAGLGAAHAQGIVHRDLKPENVILAREASGAFTPKILDFGIAKVMDAAGGMGCKTKTGVLLGTPAYMSPEQIKNAKDVDPRSDLWSAGVMLYEMLTGRVAFVAPTEYARLSAVLQTTPQPLETIDPQLARLSAFELLAMQKDRTQRFQTALEMARALAAAIGIDSGTTSAASPLSRLPDVASVWVRAEPGASPIAESSPTNPGPPPTMTFDPPRNPKGPFGTLASPLGRAVSEPPPHVILAGVQGTQGTLPSENLPMLRAHDRAEPRGPTRGVAPWLVAVLVFVALAAGFVLGLVVSRI